MYKFEHRVRHGNICEGQGCEYLNFISHPAGIKRQMSEIAFFSVCSLGKLTFS